MIGPLVLINVQLNQPSVPSAAIFPNTIIFGWEEEVRKTTNVLNERHVLKKQEQKKNRKNKEIKTPMRSKKQDSGRKV